MLRHCLHLIQPRRTKEIITNFEPKTIDKTIEKIEEWAFARNFVSGSDPKTQLLKALSEMGELADAILKNDKEGQKDGIGDVIVVLTIVAMQLGLTIEQCLNHSYDQIKDRKGVMYDGAFIKSDDARYAAAVAELNARNVV